MNELITQWNNPETIERLKLLREKILNDEYKKGKREWGGAGLIITSNTGDKRKAEIKIVTKHAKPITYLLYQLKDIYKEDIDYFNKRKFYEDIVTLIDKEDLEKEEDSKKVLLELIERIINE